MSFWDNKRVLVTGHTGFKGSWLCQWLTELGTQLSGVSLAPEPHQTLFEQLDLPFIVDHNILDIRDAEKIASHVLAFQPDVVFHMAAAPLVLASYNDPIGTWSTNLTGSLCLMEALRELDKKCAAVFVTTDKVYLNKEWYHPYRETDDLGGRDPYSASKSAMEIAINCWRASFFQDHKVSLVSARAGNVIGGGDWAENRIVPDIARALGASRPVNIRQPNSVRPFQHVLEPLSGYLRLAEALYNNPAKLDDCYNFGPAPSDVKSVRELVEIAFQVWPGEWIDGSTPKAKHEAGLLSLSTELARNHLGYSPRWEIEQGIKMTMEWYYAVQFGQEPRDITLKQIHEFGAP